MAKGFNRREFLGCATTGAVSWYFSKGLDWPAALAAPSGSGFFDQAGPVDRTIGDKAPARFFGDDPSRAHSLLREIPAYLKKTPLPTEWETTDLVVIGGGMSGLFSAYAFRASKPIVLEQAERFGGNSKGQSWRGIDYGMGGAYFAMPTPGTLFHRYFQEMELEKQIQRVPASDPLEVNGKIVPGFWEGAAEPEHVVTYTKLAAFFRDMATSKRGIYPEIPPVDAKGLANLQELDKKSLAQAIEDAVGKLPPLLARGIDAYCLSSFAAPAHEVSAAAGLSFLAVDNARLCVASGGNAGLAEQVLRCTMKAGVPATHLRTGSVVLRVTVEGEKVKVLYEGPDKKLRGIVAKAAIMACPKFVVSRILEGIEPERAKAIQEIEYRSYLTATALINKPFRNRFYDLYLLNEKTKTDPTYATDVVLGSLGQPRGRNTVLTLYRALPSKSARAELSQSDAHPKIHAQFQNQIETQLLPLLGFRTKDLVDLRIARWGHAIPLAAKGAFAKGLPEILRNPFRSRVFFIEQDNWLTPCIETGIGELALQEPIIRAAIDAKTRTR